MTTRFEKNLTTIQAQLLNIGYDLVEANRLLLDALRDCDEIKFHNAKAHIRNIENKPNELDADIINFLALYAPEAKNLRELISYLKITNELSRTFTNTKNLIKNFTELCNSVDINAIREYSVPMQISTLKALEQSINMIDITNCEDRDELDELYREVLIEEHKTNDLYEVVERCLSVEEFDENGFRKFHQILKALRKSSKIASRATAIATLILYIDKNTTKKPISK